MYHGEGLSKLRGNDAQCLTDMFMLICYSTSPEKCRLSAEHSCTIRGALFSLVKYYVGREITFDELNYIVGFLVVVKEETLVSCCLMRNIA